MALTPWNRQEEWYQQMINASTGNYLPSITAQDEGKVLTVESDGSWGVENPLPTVETTDKDKYLHTNASTGAVEWSAAENELPTVTSADKDKFLHTNESTGAVEWADAPTELPSVSGTDEGKVLTVNDSGEWVAQNPSSGGGLLVVKFAYANGTSICDHTFAEIHAAVTAGNCVLGYVSDGDDVIKPLAYDGRGEKGKYYLNDANVYYNGGLKKVRAEINEDNAVTVTVREINI